MTIIDHISTGGQGSGCHGDNCGRPSTVEKGADFREGDRALLFKPELQVGDKVKLNHAITVQIGKRKSERFPSSTEVTITKVVGKDQQGNENYQVRLSNKSIAYVDSRDLQVPRMLKLGTEVRIEKKLATLPGQPQRYQVANQKTGKLLFVDSTQLGYKPNQKQQYDPIDKLSKNIPEAKKSQTVYKTTLADGTKYTLMKPGGEPRTKEDDPYRVHYMKGNFHQEVEVKGFGSRVTAVWTARTGKYENIGVGSKRPVGPGVSVLISRYAGSKTAAIQEVKTGQYGHSIQLLRSYKFSNLGTAAGFLNQRYGIKQSSKNLWEKLR